MARSGNAGSTINLGVKFFSNGSLFDPYQINDVNIFDAPSGGSLIATLTPVQVSTGHYQISYDIPSYISIGTFYDEWVYTAEVGMVSHTRRYSFEVLAAVTPTPEPTPTEFVPTEAHCRARPSWVHRIGLIRTEDLGNGTGVNLYWNEAIPTASNKTVHYNVYYDDTRFDVLSGNPQAITTDTSATINVDPGNQQYFVVRATEFDVSDFDYTQLEQIGLNTYAYPSELTLLADIDAYEASVQVTSTSGFPDKGFILIDVEVLQYSSKDATTFYVEEENRGAYLTFAQPHLADETVKLFRGIEDGNSVIVLGTAAWHETYARNVDAIGQFNVAEDGYRETAEDLLTTNLSASDANTAFFPNYDFCGYHRTSLQDTFSGKCIGSYIGGEESGTRGLPLQDKNLARLDTMLQVTGEAVVLLKRKQTGRRCRCRAADLRREHPSYRCPYCYSTGYTDGFSRFFNNRAISESFSNTNGMIMIRVSPFDDDVALSPTQGLNVSVVNLACWTLTYPSLRDRDVFIRFTESGEVEFFYEILNVKRNKLLFNLTGQQNFTAIRLDKSDIIYQYDYNDESKFITIP